VRPGRGRARKLLVGGVFEKQGREGGETSYSIPFLLAPALPPDNKPRLSGRERGYEGFVAL